ncbi:uncharacterized protein LOC117642647 [Thrips palmi]|uniref:Uncharacterized protein LOC117642647 n=1 Tax=Thrips palmi TaxID=161013 RepID=A0A6P8ZKE2_THRPL|nr:uncharacterized protein LOC117642647 [Thrips palmi]
MKVVLSKCREAVSSNTCEYFATWPFRGNLCGMVRAKGMMWSSFMRAFQPDLECPISKGLYKVENATIDVSLGETIAHIDIAGNVWTVEVTITDEQEKLWSCLNTAVLINRVNIKE